MLGSITGNVAILVGLCVPSVALAANLTAEEVSMVDMDRGVYSYGAAVAYCNRLKGWYIAYVNHGKGVLYCLKSGTKTSSNCNKCDTYRIVVWKNGGGEEKHCPGWYSTKAGNVYPAHVNPCRCNQDIQPDVTLGRPCTSTTTTTTTKLFPVMMKTWSFPEPLSWKITHGGKTVCKGGGYDSWYSSVKTGCRLAKGNYYKAVCKDIYGEGFRGGYLQVAGKKICHKDYMWSAGTEFAKGFRIR